MFNEFNTFLFNTFLKDRLSLKITNYNSYETFGKDVEPEISDIIEEYLNMQDLEFEIHRAKNKNYFPDLEVVIDNVSYAIEYKAGIFDKNGEKTLEPANDLGTLGSFSKKLMKFNDQIYCIFIKYSIDNNKNISINEIYTDKIYKFMGKKDVNSTTLVKYREKDGNLRPKNWNDFDNSVIYFNNIEEFRIALYKTNLYRSAALVSKHLDTLTFSDLLNIRTTINRLISKNKQKYK